MLERPNRLESLKTLRYANADMAFYTVFMTLTAGSFLVGFVQMCGGSDQWIGWLTAIPSLLGALQIFGGIWGRGFPSFKKFVLPGWLLWRLFYIPVALLPLLAIAPQAKLSVLALCIILAWACTYIVNPVFFEWLAELIPSKSRGWFFSRRNALGAGTAAVSGVVGGLILDRMRGTGQEAAGYAWVFGIGVVAALIGQFVFFQKMADVPRANVVKVSVKSSVASMLDPLRDKGFRTVLVFLVAAVGSQAFAGNFWTAFALESLKVPFIVLQVAGVTHSIGNIAASRLWGFLSDRYGNKPMLLLACFGMCLTPIPWLLCRPGSENLAFNSWLLIGLHLPMGAIWSGIALCQFNLLLATSKAEDRSSYLGLGMALQALIGGLSPILGAFVMTSLRGGTFGAMDVATAYKTLFVVTIAIRVLPVGLLFLVREPGAKRIFATLKQIGRATPRSLSAMRTLARSPSVEDRERAIDQVGMANLELAAEDLIKALHDPSPRVRRRAAEALGRMGLQSAVPDLIHQLMEHPDLVEEETVEALGVLRAEEAVEPLIRLLDSPRSLLRRAAAKSLGRIGNSKASSPLVKAAEDMNEPDLRRASLQALRTLGDPAAKAVIVKALLDPLPSVRIVACEAVADLNLTDGVFALRESLRIYEDEAASEAAYALGAVGTREDLPLILGEARRSKSITTRNRCLLGAARLFDCEPLLYRLVLTDEAERDRELEEALRDERGAVTAVQKFIAGDTQSALEQLATVDPRVRSIVRSDVEDVFLLAVAMVATKPKPG